MIKNILKKQVKKFGIFFFSKFLTITKNLNKQK